MENTIIIAIVSFLCILAHVPTLILRIVPFHEKISDKDRIRLTVIYAIGLAVDFGICMWVGNYREIDVPFYKINLIAFCIVTCIVNSINCIWVAVAGMFVSDWLYNIGTTVLNGGVSMVVFFFVNKIIFPEGAAKA